MADDEIRTPALPIDSSVPLLVAEGLMAQRPITGLDESSSSAVAVGVEVVVPEVAAVVESVAGLVAVVLVVGVGVAAVVETAVKFQGMAWQAQMYYSERNLEREATIRH